MLILLVSSFTSPPVVGGDGLYSSHLHLNPNTNIGINQVNVNDSYYPIFMGITSPSSSQVIRERNNTLGEGGIVQVQELANVTFRYAIALQNTSSFVDTVDLRLFADLPIVNSANFNNTASNTELSLSDSSKTVPLTYTGTNTTGFINYTRPNDGQVLSNATLYYYETTVVNMSVSYLPFYVKDISVGGLGEHDNGGAYNLLTTGAYFNTKSQDDFYIQNEKVNVTGNLFFADQATQALGFQYQVNGGTVKNQNFTLSYTGVNGTANITLNSYDPGTIISWTGVFYTSNDTLVNMSRIISNVDVKTVDVGDGTPHLSIKVLTNDATGYVDNHTVYSTNFSITFQVQATVPKGAIDNLYLLASATDTTPKVFDKVNGSFSIGTTNQTVDYSTFTSSTDGGQFNTTIATTTNKGLSLNETYTIVIDKVNPTISSFAVDGGQSVKTSDGSVSFNFNFADDNSGVKMAILSFGDGQSMDVNGLTTVSHRYLDFKSNTYEISLTVIDKAGNTVVQTGTLNLSATPLSRDRAPSFAVLIFFVVLILLLTSIWWGPKVVDKYNERF